MSPQDGLSAHSTLVPISNKRDETSQIPDSAGTVACNWRGCKSICDNDGEALYEHLTATHTAPRGGGYCGWKGCRTTSPDSWKFMRHLMGQLSRADVFADDTLNRRIAGHTTWQPFACSHRDCGRRFTRVEHRDRHEAIGHRKTIDSIAGGDPPRDEVNGSIGSRSPIAATDLPVTPPSACPFWNGGDRDINHLQSV